MQCNRRGARSSVNANRSLLLSKPSLKTSAKTGPANWTLKPETCPPPPRMLKLPENRRAVISWALYDWANSVYATSVLVVFAPILFSTIWFAGIEPSEVTFRWGILNSVTAAVVAILGPVLGAIADRCGRRKALLLGFVFLGAVTTAALVMIAQGHWLLASIVYIISGIGFSGANVFYDSLLVTVAKRSARDMVSALGYSMGYLGGGILLVGHVLLIQNAERLGLSDTAAIRWCFVTAAIWWVGFSIPLALYVEEERSEEKVGLVAAVTAGIRDVIGTIRTLPENRTVFLFLAAYFLYIDGVDTIIRMAVNYGMEIGLNSQDLIGPIILTQFIGFPAAIIFGRLGMRIGTRRSILIAIGCYIVITGWAARMDSAAEFYILAAAVGLVQGGIQALSRSMYSRLIPAEKASEFFGLYNLLGKSAAVIGPLLMGWIGLKTGNPRIGILSILVLFVGGGALLLLVREEPTESAD